MVVVVGVFLLRPIDFSINAEVDLLSVTTVADSKVVEIKNDAAINRLVNAINGTKYRRAIIAEREAPENLIAVVAIVCDGESFADIVVRGSNQNSFQFFINRNGDQFVAYGQKEITEILSELVF